MKKISALCLSALAGLTCVGAATADFRIPPREAAGTAAELQKERRISPALLRQNIRSKKSARGIHAPGHTAKPLVSAQTSARKPAFAEAVGGELYGALCYYEDESLDKLGLCSVNLSSGSYENIAPFEYVVNGMGVSDGVIYVAGMESTWTTVTGFYFKAYDAATGAELSSYELSLPAQDDCVMISCAYDANEKAFYGLTVNDDYDAVLTRYDWETHQFTHLGVTEPASSMTINQDTGEIVGVYQDEEYENHLVYYDRLDGSVYKQVKIDYMTDFAGGICWSPAHEAYLWNPNSYDWSKIVAVSESGSVTEVCDLADYAEFTAFATTASSAREEGAPGMVRFDGFEFDGGSLSGDVVVTLPSTTADGQPLSGSLSYALSCDREEIASGTAAAGAEVRIPVSVTEGLHSFSIVASKNGTESVPAFETRYVGNDTPLAPQNVTLTETEITWEAVTTGVHGGYVDPSAITYTVTLNGTLLASGITATSCPTGLTGDGELEEYVAEVTASFAGKESEPGRSDSIKVGEAYTVPAYFAPTEAQAGLFTITDENGDGASWKFIEGEPCRFRYGVSSESAADDWLFLPPVNIESAGDFHRFSMLAFCWSQYLHERLEVKIGRAPEAEAMTEQVIEATLLENIMPETMEGFFRVEEPGVYYIGVHAISDANRYYLYCNEFRIENTGIRGAGPAYPSDVKAVAGEKGELKATLTATLPTATIDGASIPADSEITLTAKSQAATATVSGRPGERVSLTLKTVQGMNEISVQCSLGEILGAADVVSLFTGMDVPAAITNVRLDYSADNYSVKVSWEAPVEGGNGGYIDREGIVYYLCQQTAIGWVQGAELGTDVFEYQISVPAGTPQQVVMFGIVAENNVGLAPIFYPVSVSPGELYMTPVKETFADHNADYGPVAVDKISGYTAWDIDYPDLLFGIAEAPSKGMALVGASAGAAEGMITFPKFKASGIENMALDFTLYCGQTEDVIIYASGYGAEEMEVFRLSDENAEEGYQSFMVPLPDELEGLPWVTFRMEVLFSDEKQMFVLDGYTLRSRQAEDIAVAELRAPASVAVGRNVDVGVTVENAGTNAAAYRGGTLSLVNKGGKTLWEQTNDNYTPMEPGQQQELTFSFQATPDMIGECCLNFVLAGTDDDKSNDKASLYITVKAGDAVFVGDLSGAWDSEGKAVELSWSPAEYDPGFESFEDETPFEISSDKIGEFINLDRDGKETYFWENCGDLPLLSNIAYKAGAFNVISISELNRILGSKVTAPDGDQVLLAFCPARDPETGEVTPADDWLISPECVPGTSFSFDVLPLSLQYGAEVIEVCYSEGSENPDDFQTLELIAIYEGGWEHREFVLPENGKRFAIHYVSEDKFGVMIDALRFNPANMATVDRYEVYRGGEEPTLIGEATDCRYVDSTAVATESYVYYVVPVLTDGARGVRSNLVTVAPLGMTDVLAGGKVIVGRGEILLEGFGGERVTVSSVGGELVYSGAASDCERVAVAPGVYVVLTARGSVKVIVR